MNPGLSSLELEHFNTYERLYTVFDPGLMLVTGDNGAGKSTIIEGVCWALFGKTLRGTSPENGAVRAALRFHLNDKDYLVQRSKRNLSLNVEGEELTAQTKTETQAKIDDLVGTFEQFVSTRVFARDFMARFGAATDRDRKELLEGILGLEKFDAALHVCRSDLSLQERAESSAGREAELRKGMVGKLQARYDSMQEQDVEGAKFALERARKKRAEAEELEAKLNGLIDKAEEECTRLERLMGQAEAEATAAARDVGVLMGRKKKIAAMPECTVCLRPIEDNDRKSIDDHLDSEVHEANKRKMEADHKMQVLKSQLEEATDSVSDLYVRRDDIKFPDVGRLEAEVAAAAEYERHRMIAKEDLEAAVRDAETAQATYLEASSRVAVLEQVELVLGLRGARASMLKVALVRLESEANRVLRDLGMGIQVGIKNTTVQKSGKEVEAISVSIEGAGGGLYDAASSGERARVDVGLLLGLASMKGTAGGFMAFDEVFDSLDQEGAERVAQYLAELGGHCQVVVVSHHNDIRSLFPRSRIWLAQKVEGKSSLELA